MKPTRRRSRLRRGFQAATTGRLVADWNETSGSPDVDVIPNLRLMRARSRDLCQNNDFAKRFVALGLRTAYYGDDRWLEIACEEPLILRQPLVRSGNLLSVGLAEESWKEWVAR